MSLSRFSGHDLRCHCHDFLVTICDVIVTISSSEFPFQFYDFLLVISFQDHRQFVAMISFRCHCVIVTISSSEFPFQFYDFLLVISFQDHVDRQFVAMISFRCHESMMLYCHDFHSQDFIVTMLLSRFTCHDSPVTISTAKISLSRCSWHDFHSQDFIVTMLLSRCYCHDFHSQDFIVTILLSRFP